MRRCAAMLTATIVVTGMMSALGGVQTAGAVVQSTVVIQGGTTPVDSGLYQNVILPQFSAAFPQYNLQYVSVGTAAAIANAQAGQGDVVFTHSPTAENTFVTGGYSYEAGGRLVMASDFVTVGDTTDPANVAGLGVHDAVAAFSAIAAAGNAGTADFVSRGDGSGTNKNEQTIWKLTGIPVNTAGEPTDPANPSNLAPWYHKSGLGQGQNLQVTNQCPFTSGKCYTLTDSGTFNNLVAENAVPDLSILSQFNDGPGAKGGVSLLLNPYHLYAVNPAKITNAHINLPGALAFLNFMTDPTTQAAIASYPSAAVPAFVPDARPTVTVNSSFPASIFSGQSVTVSGTVKPNYFLDPAITNAPIFVERAGAPGVIVASANLAAGGAFTMTFSPTTSDTYSLFVPAFPDGLVLPSNTAYRQSTGAPLGALSVFSGVPGPSVVHVTPGDGQAIVTWTPPANPGGSPVTGYTVSGSSGSIVLPTQNVSAPTTTATFTGLTNGKAYTFVVKAINTQGTGAASTGVASTPVRTTVLVAGETHACTILPISGAVRCWGSNTQGELGDGTKINRTASVPVTGITGAVGLALGLSHTCALLSDATVKCWGGNGAGQLGDGTTTPHLAPTPVSGLTGVKSIDAEGATTCAVLANGTMKCWGLNTSGQLGDGTLVNRHSPVAVFGLTGVAQTSGSPTHRCAALTNLTLRCWGLNASGQLGDGTTTNRSKPVAVPGVNGVAHAVSAHGAFTCDLLTNATVKCWGLNNFGQLGNGTLNPSHVPVTVSGLTTVASIGGGAAQTCARLTNATVKCWGHNNFGQLGDGTLVNRTKPVVVTGLANVLNVQDGDAFSAARLNTGGLRTWGANQVGQLGDATTNNRSHPVVVAGLS